jgi:hypothetical protein
MGGGNQNHNKSTKCCGEEEGSDLPKEGILARQNTICTSASYLLSPASCKFCYFFKFFLLYLILAKRTHVLV